VVNDPVNYIDPFGLTSTDSGSGKPTNTNPANKKATLTGWWSDTKKSISNWWSNEKKQIEKSLKDTKLGNDIKEKIGEVADYPMINNTDDPFYSFSENDENSNDSDGAINLETGQGYKISDGWSVTITKTSEIDKNGNPKYNYEPKNEVPWYRPVLRAIAEKKFNLKTYDSYEDWENSAESGWLEKPSFKDAKDSYDSSKKY